MTALRIQLTTSPYQFIDVDANGDKTPADWLLQRPISTRGGVSWISFHAADGVPHVVNLATIAAIHVL